MTKEQSRLQQARQGTSDWKKWGPYLSERQWGTVREDYSQDGNAWDYFSHDQARSRAYHWGEDGLAGISDDRQRLCFSISLWNGKDPILKERCFGLTNSESNHGEDVKEYYFYLDSTPTHSYMKYLYKYPHAAFPYNDLVTTSKGRNRGDMEYELLDTGIFNSDRYFDVFVEYAKQSAEDILIQISISNRGPESATLHVLPTLLFRNTWTWWPDTVKPSLKKAGSKKDVAIIAASHDQLGDRYLYCEGNTELLFTENETNNERIFGTPNASPFVKDGINNYVVNGKKDVVNPQGTGTKAAAHYSITVGAGQTAKIRLRLTDLAPTTVSDPFAGFDEIMQSRLKDADEFYQAVLPQTMSEDARNIARQAFAGMLWSKQYYHYVVTDWLDGDPAQPPPPAQRREGRNREWRTFFARDVISMPDKWEFPWFASWDLAFHCVALAHVDSQFAKEQILLMLREWYMHPNGQLPAYEWDFGDVNPPILPAAARAVFEIECRPEVSHYSRHHDW